MRVHLDLELAGTLRLDEVGVDVWSRHKDTVPILIGFAFNDDPVRVIRCTGNFAADNDSCDLITAVHHRGAEVHAWNATFERTVWNTVLVKHGFPLVPSGRFHCTMATAANAGLPMKLEDAALAVGSPFVKDKDGTALMKRMAKPRAFHPNGSPRWWHSEDLNKLLRLEAYNKADVEAEREISCRIPRMSKREREIWLVDQKMNERGLPVDPALLGALSAITLQELLSLNSLLTQATKGAVTSVSQNTRLLAWLQTQGYMPTTLAKNLLGEFLKSPTFRLMAPHVKHVLRLRAEAAKTSTAKLHSVGNYSLSGTVRAKNLVQYAGATRTLRWAGRGPQIQNFPRPIIKHVDQAIEQILLGMDAEGLRHTFGRPLDVVSSCLRGLFKAPDGFQFVVADYHAVEAVVLAWLAEFKQLLEVFRQGEDVYVFTANSIRSNDRQLGKVLRLACGYGMGPVKFRKTALQYGLDLNEHDATEAVRDFRQANLPIVTLWRGYEENARNAILNPGKTYDAGKIKFRMAKAAGRVAGSLVIEKPAGGHLVYREARIDDEGRIAYQGVHQTTRQWTTITTYGGKLVENVTQAVARDLIADAMVAVEHFHPGTLVGTVHDEIIALAPDVQVPTLIGFLKFIMSRAQNWARGMPLSASAYVSKRYGKA